MLKKWPNLVLLVMLSGAIIGWRIAANYTQDKLEDAFLAEAFEVQNQLNTHVQAYVEVLYGTQGLFAASQQVDRAEWGAFVRALRISDRLDSVRAVRYVEYVRHEQLDGFIESIRHGESFPAFERDLFYVFPVDRQDEYAIVTYIEPFRGNEAMFGYNLYSDPSKKEVLERSCLTGQASASPVIELMLNPPQKGFFVSLPVFRSDQPVETEDERRLALKGYVNVIVTTGELMVHLDTTVRMPEGMFFKVWDGTDSRAAERLMFDSGQKDTRRVRLEKEMPIRIFDRQWTLGVYMTRSFSLGWLDTLYPYSILFAGVFISLLTYRSILSLQRSERQALSVVSDMSQELSKKQVYLEQMVRSAPDPMITLDLMGFLRDMNPAAERTIGFSSKDLLGRHFSQMSILTEKSLTKAVQEFALVAAGQERPLFELNMIRKDRQPITVEAHARRVDTDKQFPHIQVILRDITQRKQAEESTRQMKDRLDMALRSAQMGVWAWNVPANTFAIDEFMAGFMGRKDAPRNSTYEAFLESVAPEDRVAVEQEVQRALVRGNELHAEFRTLTQDKNPRVVSLRGRVERNEQGQPIQMAGVAWDVTDGKKMQLQLVQAQKMETIGVFSGGIAHDLNNQLSPVIGYLNLIMKELGETHTAHNYLVEALQSANRCAEIVQRLMNFSRASTKKKESVSIQALFTELGKILPKFLPSTIHLTIQDGKDLPAVLGSENELETVIMNLAANARDAMPNGGKLVIKADLVDEAKDPTDPEASPGGPYVCLSVSDTGCGMEPEILHKIFEPFFTTKEKGKGTGLGLAMVFNIIKDHKGWIEVSSDVGRGTSFTIYLPALSDPSRAAGRPAAKAAATGALPRWKGTALFVDDEDYMRKLGKVFLERLGFRVLLAADGEEAVQVFASHKADIAFVMMDMTMPKQTGRATLKKILEIHPKARVIVASGFTSEGQPEELIAAGAADYIQKPYTILSIVEVLKKFMG